MTYTIKYETTGQRGCDIIRVFNYIGRFSSIKEAQQYLDRSKVNGVIVESVA